MGGLFSDNYEEEDDESEEDHEILSGYYSRFEGRNIVDSSRNNSEFEVAKDLSGIEDLKNYGILPLGTLIKIFEMMNLRELLNCSCSCKLFYSIIQTSIFWKLYYENITGRKYSKNENIIDWKYEVFKTLFTFEAKTSYFRKLFFDPVSVNWNESRKRKGFFQYKNGKIEKLGRSNRNYRYPFDMLIKFLLIGDSGVGKSSIMMRKAEDRYNTEIVTTIGIDFKVERAMYKDTQIKYQIWDTAGQERFRTIIPAYYKTTNGILLCFPINNEQSFLNLRMWYNEIIKNVDELCKIVVVGCKCDLEKERKVFKKDIVKLLDEFGLDYSSDYCECSSKDNLYIDLPFGMLMDKCLHAYSNLMKKR